jgi:hypothetical protein
VPDLRSVMAKLFPEASILKNPGIKEKGRSFSIRLNEGQEAFGIDLEKLADWPRDRKRCDVLFVCSMPDRADFMVVLVELKGSDTGHAIDQIEESRKTLCKGSAEFSDTHCPATVAAVRASGMTGGHNRMVVGVIVTGQGLPQRLLERKKLHKSVRLKLEKKKYRADGVDELFSLLPPKDK